ncbi:MAG: 23S rRNA (uracil(1939)-C(5))-methyltransferase RlmD [Prolixibacteraceae bacterium]|nr:23S rRNA (uracil(1939)-C(5))-methyltransferase RlmD [Prolixibacteraceae bacterium]
MGKSRKNKPFFPSVMITDIGAEGKAIARVNDIVVFTTHVIPGDIVDLQVIKKRKNYYEARVTNLVKPSSDRIDAFCEHFGKCGGCKWQYLPYKKQLFYKQKQVLDQLTRIGHLDLPEISPILGSKKDKFYRNKLEFSFSNKRWLSDEEIKSGKENISEKDVLGFHVPLWFDKVIDINKCWLQPEPSNSIRNFIKEYALEHELEFFDIREHKGFLRNLIIRTSSTGENMMILSFFKEDKGKRESLLESIVQKFPELNSVLYVINQKANDTLADQDIKTYKGTDYIFEEMEGLKFKIGPKSFYQTNSDQAYELYKVARNFAGLTGKETVYDLYTGTGTIANFVAGKAKNVIGIEYIPEAIENAKENSELNNIKNTIFFAGDMKDIFNSSFIKENGHPDVVITDPPRAGMHEDVVNTLLKVAPERIVYISCNPATQARDLGLMATYYKIIKIQPVDMFPHTHHVENVVLLDKI